MTPHSYFFAWLILYCVIEGALPRPLRWLTPRIVAVLFWRHRQKYKGR